MFTTLLPGLFDVSHQTELVTQNLKSLEEHRIINDISFIFKIIINSVDLPSHIYLYFNMNNTSGHSMKLIVNFSRLEYSRYCVETNGLS